MDNGKISALESWVAHKYATGTRVESSTKTIILAKDIVYHSGVKVYTDGVKEISKDFSLINISGFNYVVVCFYGKEYSSLQHRIIIYCNSTSDWDLSKYKKTVKEILNSYK
jgi:hypothetical protein